MVAEQVDTRAQGEAPLLSLQAGLVASGSLSPSQRHTKAHGGVMKTRSRKY